MILLRSENKYLGCQNDDPCFGEITCGNDLPKCTFLTHTQMVSFDSPLSKPYDAHDPHCVVTNH